VKITKELLSPEEKAILADFVNSEYWPVYRKVQMNSKENILKVAISSANMEELAYHRGRIYQIQQEIADFTRNFTKIETNKQKVKEKKKEDK